MNVPFDCAGVAGGMSYEDMCGLCDDHTYDDTIHVLFVCDKLEPLRSRLYEKLVSSMPCALSLEFYDMCKQDETWQDYFERDYNRYKVELMLSDPIKPISAWRAEESVEVSDKWDI